MSKYGSIRANLVAIIFTYNADAEPFGKNAKASKKCIADLIATGKPISNNFSI
tara:strand:- start:27 stop:185 length:159 start_codon:yes stop_codon:yes gene_type:complete